LKREFAIFVQYVALAALAGLLAFHLGLASDMAGSEVAVAINMGEAWRNFAPVWKDWLLVFAALGGVRLLVVALTRKVGKRPTELI
jgi:hypothetical protein